MAYKRTKKMLLSVAAVSLGAVAPIACASNGGVIGDIAIPPDASDASDSGNNCALGKCAQDAGPESSFPDVVVGAMPLDASKD